MCFGVLRTRMFMHVSSSELMSFPSTLTTFLCFVGASSGIRGAKAGGGRRARADQAEETGQRAGEGQEFRRRDVNEHAGAQDAGGNGVDAARVQLFQSDARVCAGHAAATRNRPD